MTTINLRGIRLHYTYDAMIDDDVVTAVGSATAQLIMPSAQSTFSYQIEGSEFFPDVSIDADLMQIMFEGRLVQDIEEQAGQSVNASIGQATWSGGSTVAMVVEVPDGNGGMYDMIFYLGGAELPAINTPEDWNAFDDSITGASAAPGAFAPGQNIMWTAFANHTLTEDDEFVGTSGRDRFDGGIGDDYFTSSAGNDTYIGGAGSFDQVNFRLDPGGVTANLAKGFAIDGFGDRDTLKGIEVLRGSMFDDTLIGKGGRNVFRGLEGDDVINGARGKDEVRYDRDERYGGDSGVTVNLRKGTAIDGFGDTDTLRNIADVNGSDQRDIIIGSGGNNVLEGLGGNDRLFGLAGKDTILGGGGKDKIDGGGGDDILAGNGKADRFIFSGSFGNDTIIDFQTRGKAEKIDLSDVESIRSFRDLKKNHLTNEGGDALIDAGGGNTIAIAGHLKADLSANDFIF